VATFLVRLDLLRIRAFDPDELQHLHAAWSFQQGLLPFRDFFEHHMPGIYYLLAPMMRMYDTAHDFDAVLSVIFLSRTLMWLFAAATIGFTVLLGRKYRSPEIGWLSGALLSLSVVFIGRTLEIRPDVPALALWAASIWAIAGGLSPDSAEFRRSRWALSGLLFGGTLLFTQKALLAGPGFAVFALVYLFTNEKPTRSFFAKCLDLVTFGVCIGVPLAVVVAHYWWRGAAGFFLDGTLRNNLGWIQETTASATLRWTLLRDPIACALVVGGIVFVAVDVVSDADNRVMHAAVLLPTASLFAGMAVIPAPFPQYLLLVMPVAALYAANGLWICLSRDDGVSQSAKVIAVLAFVVTAIVGLWVARPFFRSPLLYPLLGAAALAAMVAFARFGRADYACLTLVAVIAVLTAQQLLWMAGLSNRETLDEMRFIHQVSAPADTVMDGFSGFGWFRPHAAYYWFTAPGVRARLSTTQRASFVSELASCADAPKIVILDQHLHAVSPQIDQTVSANYRETRYPVIWLRGTPGERCKS
jgi:hypothetical protein